MWVFESLVVRGGVQDSQSSQLLSALHLFGPVHSRKERVGLNVIHSSHAGPQSLQWVVLEQLNHNKEVLVKHPQKTYLEIKKEI